MLKSEGLKDLRGGNSILSHSKKRGELCLRGMLWINDSIHS